MRNPDKPIEPEAVIRALAYGILAGIAVVVLYSTQPLYVQPAAPVPQPVAIPAEKPDKPRPADTAAPEAAPSAEAKIDEAAPELEPSPPATARATAPEPEQQTRKGKAMAVLGTGLLLAGSALLAGAFLGFLFGIPRSLQQAGTSESGSGKDAAETPQGGSGRAGYGANTSLEQISDWLTKILVGVGLTQLSSLPSALEDFAKFAVPGLGGYETSSVFAVALLIYFLTCGFLMSYLWTRLYLGKAFTEADALAKIRGEIKTAVVSELQQKAQGQLAVDYEALRLTEKQLESGDVPQEELDRAFRGTSDLFRTHIYQLARTVRRDNWRDRKPRMERTIPIFRALIATDEKKERFHQNYGQLAFALAEASKPDYANAIATLDKAIELRGPAREQGYLMYEFVRAKCRADPAATDPETKELVIKDLKEALYWPELEEYARTDHRLSAWLKANHVSVKSLVPHQT